VIRASLLLALVAAGCATASKPARFALPEDPGAIVVLLAKSRGADEPQALLELSADATLRTRNGSKAANAADLQELLAYIVDDQRFFDIDEQAIRLAVHQSNSRHGSAVVVMDAPTTHITVRLHDREHTVAQYSLAFRAQRFSDVDPLRRLAAIERRIIRFGAVAHLGGQERAEQFAAAANRALAKAHPSVAAFTLDDLSTAGTRRDGAIVAHFRRASTPTTITFATVAWPDGGEPAVQVQSNEAANNG